MAAYKIQLVEDNTLQIGFADPSQNDEIVIEVERRMTELVQSGVLKGGEILKVNGPASLPVAMCIAHNVGHLYQAIACYDPKLSQYVVAIAHGDKYRVGDLIALLS